MDVSLDGNDMNLVATSFEYGNLVSGLCRFCKSSSVHRAALSSLSPVHRVNSAVNSSSPSYFQHYRRLDSKHLSGAISGSRV
jgi:hypothetical protein